MNPTAVPTFRSLIRFIEKKLPEALKKEEYNTTHVYFYRCGNVWIAIERSAYAICQQYSLTDEVILIDNLETNRSVVMLVVNEQAKEQMPLEVRIPLFPYCQWKNSQLNRSRRIKKEFATT